MAEKNSSGYAIGELAGRFGLSRSTLLYYDRIGLLRPSHRTAANYRRYSESDRERLARICFYRGTGLSLEEIARLLASPNAAATGILEDRLRQVETEIQSLKEQRDVLLKLLGAEWTPERMAGMDRERWTALLRSVGLNDADMHRWHREFERMAPTGHRDFLRSLGIPEKEVRRIRAWSME
jgi:DNA-binding transcriptional MerR regulator